MKEVYLIALYKNRPFFLQFTLRKSFDLAHFNKYNVMKVTQFIV